MDGRRVPGDRSPRCCCSAARSAIASGRRRVFMPASFRSRSRASLCAPRPTPPCSRSRARCRARRARCSCPGASPIIGSRVPRRRPRPRDRRVVGPGRHRGRGRPVRGRLADRRVLVALGVPRERPARDRRGRDHGAPRARVAGRDRAAARRRGRDPRRGRPRRRCAGR